MVRPLSSLMVDQKVIWGGQQDHGGGQRSQYRSCSGFPGRWCGGARPVGLGGQLQRGQLVVAVEMTVDDLLCCGDFGLRVGGQHLVTDTHVFDWFV